MKKPHFIFEKEAWDMDLCVCGVDEVGRGCIAGPVVAAAVSFPKEHIGHEKVRDSKKLTPKAREELFDFILDECDDFGIGLVSAEEIDQIGIVMATRKAMTLAVQSIGKRTDLVLIDAMVLPDVPIVQKSIIKGDENVYSIAAASIIAKVFRDKVVTGLDNVYADYGFGAHKGYGTKVHYEAIKAKGLTPEHRRSFLTRVKY
jgi:ribonuclease HII